MEPPPRRRRLGWFGVVAVVVFLALAPWAWAAPDVPTIVFSATGTQPAGCDSRPNVSSLTVPIDSKFMIANMTGGRATVDVGGRTVIELAPGAGALMRLSHGQHDLRLIPDCMFASDGVAVVNVLTPSEIFSRPTSSVTITAGSSRAASSQPRGAGSGTRTPLAVSAAQSPGLAPPTSAPSVASGRVDSLGAEVLQVETARYEPVDSPKGVRLLATIATICTLGVTAAIIRAIVTQRTTGSVG
jgi:hypothetical protein